MSDNDVIWCHPRLPYIIAPVGSQCSANSAGNYLHYLGKNINLTQAIFADLIRQIYSIYNL